MAHVTPTKTPGRKVGAGALAGAVTVIGVYVAESFGAEVPPEVASAVTTVLSFVTSYLVRE